MSQAPDGPFSLVEVITSVQRLRRWSTAEQVRLVEEAMRPGMSVSFVALQAGVSPFQLFSWKRGMLEDGHGAGHHEQRRWQRLKTAEEEGRDAVRAT